MGAMDVLTKWDFYKKIPEVSASCSSFYKDGDVSPVEMYFDDRAFEQDKKDARDLYKAIARSVVGPEGCWLYGHLYVKRVSGNSLVHLANPACSMDSPLVNASHPVNELWFGEHLAPGEMAKLPREAQTQLYTLRLDDQEFTSFNKNPNSDGSKVNMYKNINRSLSALGDVIAALGASSKHVPYRNSKLTFLLQDSLSGNSKVLMLVNVSPVQWNAWETLCSLNFASRCRSVALGQAKAAPATGPAPGNGMQATMSLSAMIPSSNGDGRPAAPGTRPVPNR